MFNRKYIFQGSIFHCYVSLPDRSVSTSNFGPCFGAPWIPHFVLPGAEAMGASEHRAEGVEVAAAVGSCTGGWRPSQPCRKAEPTKTEAKLGETKK